MEKNILDYLESTVAKFPSKVAITEEKKEITFSKLVDDSKRLCVHIKEATNGVEKKPVGVLLNKSIEAIISNIAILYSNNIYMNLDVKNPKDRIKNILLHIQPSLVITNNEYIELLNEIFPKDKIINLDEIDLGDYLYSKDYIPYYRENQIDTDVMCIINTSGSTGTPKGVALSHRNFIDFTEWSILNTNIGDEIIGSLSPIIFDIYSFELCLLMKMGSTMVLIPDKLAAFPIKILEFIDNHNVSFIFWVPTIMVNIANLDLLSKIKLEKLKSIWFAGEVFPTKQFNYWQSKITNAQFINLYGPIEITLDCTYYIVNRKFSDEEPLPIGTACKNVDVMLLNEENELCIDNEEGEICVRGSSLALGYYNDFEKTQEVFVQNPLNNSYPEMIYRTGDIGYRNDLGEIIFKGRKDTLIKHSGYRIDLGEIEHIIINKLAVVKNGCAVYDQNNKKIVFYYEMGNEDINSTVKRHLMNFLPKYMMPNLFVKLTELPMNPNGKIDRLKLKKLIDKR